MGSDEILVGIVGRLTEIKNHELFLQAAAVFKSKLAAQLSPTKTLPKPDDEQRQNARVRFLVIGDGALRNALEQQAGALGLEDDVIFTGSRRDLENVYPALDIVALTSRNEGTPLTLIEAMANARPVISTAVGGVVDLLGAPVKIGFPDSPALVRTGSVSDRLPVSQPANQPFQICARGISVPPDDDAAFAAGLARLVTDATLRRETGERGLQFVVTHYSRERLLEDIKNLYADLLKEK